MERSHSRRQVHLYSSVFSTRDNVHLWYLDSWDSLSAFPPRMRLTLAVRNRNIPISESFSIHAVSMPRLGWVRWSDNPYSQTCWHKRDSENLIRNCHSIWYPKLPHPNQLNQLDRAVKYRCDFANSPEMAAACWRPSQMKGPSLASFKKKWWAPKWALQSTRQMVDGNKELKGISLGKLNRQQGTWRNLTDWGIMISALREHATGEEAECSGFWKHMLWNLHKINKRCHVL